VEKYCRGGQVTNDNMAHARGMMDTIHPEYLILIALPLPHCLHERSSVLRYTDNTFLVLL
jgi:hypothetical protein